jgi:probable F420-dependent oxidoreductase
VTADHDAAREALGRVGAWTFTFDWRSADLIAADVAAIETMGYRALWLPEGGGSNDILTNLGWALGASRRLTLASGIANISAREPDVLARGSAFLAEAYPNRLVLGVGVGHSYSTVRRGIEWDRPLARMRAYLDVMDEDDSRPPAPRLLAALGDGMLRLSATRALGAHSYFVPVTHTAHARSVLGSEPVLAVELGVMPGTNASTARAWGRAWAASYLELPNYANNWRRLGFDENDVAGTGSDRLLDAAFVWGSPEVIAARARKHLDAGADHVCVQVIGAPDGDAETDLRGLEELAPLLLSV